MTLERLFRVKELGSSVRTEVFAGVSTFLALSYIFVVNPSILADAGIDKSAAFIATIVGSVVTTLLMGLWANKPFAVAPGLEMNAYVAYVVVGVAGFTWQGALGAVFWSGVLTVIFSLTNVRVKVLESIPELLKIGLGACVGVFLLLIALKVSGLLAYDGIKLVGLGSLVSASAWVFYFGLASAWVFKRFRVRGAILLSIVLASVLASILGIAQDIGGIELSARSFSAFGALDLGIIFNPKVWSVVLVLFVLDFYGSIAKFIGLTKNTSIVDEGGNLPKLKEAMVVDGAGTVLGAYFGTSNLITFVESAVGIGEGGRTGLVAVVVAVLMLLFIPLVPLLNLVPTVATTGALFVVGLSLIPFKNLASYVWWEKLVLLVMLLVTVVTFGLDKALFAGFFSFILLALAVGKFKLLNPYLVFSTFVLLTSLILGKLI